jgi:cytochrome c-type biogenesis protein CcmE
MAQTVATQGAAPVAKGGGRMKFIVGGLLIVAAIAYLISTSIGSTQQYFFTIQELNERGQSVVGKNVRVSGAVIGDSIQYDAQTFGRASPWPMSRQIRKIDAQAEGRVPRPPSTIPMRRGWK